MKFVNLYRADEDNAGDLASAAGRYADALGLGGTWKYLQYTEGADAARFGDLVVLGGGGLGNDYFPMRVSAEALVKSAGRVVVWGVGTNYYDMPRHYRGKDPTVESRGLEYPTWMGALRDAGALIGVRDFSVDGGAYRWVPCPSCMMPGLEAARHQRPSVKVAAVAHPDSPVNGGFPEISMRADVENILAHIASAEAIVTTSYHGAYWALLMGRRAVAWKPNANRFRFMRHAPAFASTEAELRTAIESAPVYPAALEECREATLRFAADVAERR